MLTTILGTWPLGGNSCTATLCIDRPRSISISFEWSREPGPTEIEHLGVMLPHIVDSALEPLEELATMCKTIVELITDGHLCRIGIKDGHFVYAATDQDQSPRG